VQTKHIKIFVCADLSFEAKQLDIVLLLNRVELHHCNSYCQKVDPVTDW
jgi:hypothetical protein